MEILGYGSVVNITLPMGEWILTLYVTDAAGNLEATTQNNNQSSLNEVRILEVASKAFDTSDIYQPQVVKVDANTFAVAYRDGQNDGIVRSFDVPTNGSSITVKSPHQHEGWWAQEHNFVQVDANTYAVAYRYGDSR